MPNEDRKQRPGRPTTPVDEHPEPELLQDLELNDATSDDVRGGRALPGVWQNHNEVLVTSV